MTGPLAVRTVSLRAVHDGPEVAHTNGAALVRHALVCLDRSALGESAVSYGQLVARAFATASLDLRVALASATTLS